jgi:rubredoxin
MSMAVPPSVRDCVDCGEKAGMQLQNVAPGTPGNIPLLYICHRCGTQLTIAPPPLQFEPTAKDYDDR